VLRILGHTDIVTSDYRLAPYLERCTAEPHSGGRWLRNWRISGRWRSLKARHHALGSERAFACAKSAPPKCWSGRTASSRSIGDRRRPAAVDLPRKML
jgi:hypothetical protein